MQFNVSIARSSWQILTKRVFVVGLTYLGFFQGSVDARLEVSKIRENALLELLHVLYRTSERFEPEDQRAYDIRASNVIETTPEHTRDVFRVWEEEPIERWVTRVWVTNGKCIRFANRWFAAVHRPSRGSSGKEEFQAIEMFERFSFFERKRPAEAVLKVAKGGEIVGRTVVGW